MDGFLHITGQQKAGNLPTDASAELQVRRPNLRRPTDALATIPHLEHSLSRALQYTNTLNISVLCNALLSACHECETQAFSSSRFMVRALSESMSAERGCHHLQAALRARPRKAVAIKAPLKNNARLDGIYAKLADGQLTITIPKQVGTLSCCPGLLPDARPFSSVVREPQKRPQSPPGQKC